MLALLLAGVGLAVVPTLYAAGQPAAPAAAAPAPLVLPKLDVVVTIAPLRMIVQRIVPEGSSIEQLIPTGVSEHGYEIPPGKLRLLSKADLVVRIGDALEPQVSKALLAGPRPTRQVAAMMADGDGDGHDHDGHDHADEQAKGAAKDGAKAPAAGAGNAKPHVHADGETCDDHAGSDPHVWLDPLVMEKFAEQIGKQTTELLIARAPDGASHAEIAAAIAKRVAAVTAEIRAVHAEYEAALAGKAHRTIVVTHDAWGHLASRYNIKTVALKGLSAAEPTMASLKLAAETIKRERLTTVFLEPQLSVSAGKRIAEATGAKTAMLDPLGSGDWFVMMRANLAAIVASLPEKGDTVKR